MNSRLLLTLIPLAGLLLAGCNKSEPEAAAPPAKTAKAPPVAELPPPPVTPPLPAGPSESEKHLTEKMRTMELRQAELEQQLEAEKLARLEAEIAKERDLMEKERQAWALEQQLAAAKETPSPSVSKKPVLQAPAYNPDSAYDYQTFYDDLTPYGSWYNSPDYGYVWQPSVYLSDTSWRPYTRGCWNSCDAGWMWASDEPFGWACYHYGRWAQCRERGWIWIPGDQWAPAWVCWRKNDDYVGWCPLPPETLYQRDCTWGPTVDADCGIHPGCYVFVPAKHFDRPVLGYCEAPATCLRICGSTTNITNLICRPGRVQCDGPRYDWVSKCVRRPVPRYELAFEAGRDAHSHPSHRVENDRIHIFAPKVETPWNNALRPRAQVAVMEKTEIIRSTSGVPDKLVQRYKTDRAESEKAMTSTSSKTARHIMERQQKLAEMEKSRETVAAEAQRQAETVKSKMASVPQRPEVPTGKPPRALPVEPQQTGGDVPPPPAGGKARPSRAAAGVGGLVREDNQVPDPASPGNAQTEAANQAAANSKDSRIKAMEEQRRQLAEARAAQAAKDQQASEQAAAGQRNAVEAASEAAAANPKGSRIQAMEEQRRQLAEARAAQAAKDQQASEQAAAGQRNAVEAAKAAADQAAANSKGSRVKAMEDQRRQLEEARAAQASEQANAQRAALVERQHQAEAQRAALAEQKNQIEAQRAAAAAAEQQRQAAAAKDRSSQQESAREQTRADSRRAAMDDARQAETAARAEQAARQREEIERQRAANEQQRRVEEANRVESSRQAAMQEQRRQAEAAQQQREAAQAAQREAAQREAAQAAQRESAQREAAAAAAEQQRRAAEENTRREAADRSRQEQGRNGKPRP